MAKKEAPGFEVITANKWLMEFKRKGIDKHPMYGFMIDYNEEFSLLNCFDAGNFLLNGYSVIRAKDIGRYHVYDDPEYYLPLVLKLKKITPRPLKGISLESWEDVLVTANEQFPLITIHREEIDKRTCKVGKVEDTGNKKFSLYEIDSGAVWDKTYKYKYSELTKIDFGGAYENALHLVAEYDRKLDEADKKP